MQRDSEMEAPVSQLRRLPPQDLQRAAARVSSMGLHGAALLVSIFVVSSPLFIVPRLVKY